MVSSNNDVFSSFRLNDSAFLIFHSLFIFQTTLIPNLLFQLRPHIYYSLNVTHAKYSPTGPTPSCMVESIFFLLFYLLITVHKVIRSAFDVMVNEDMCPRLLPRDPKKTGKAPKEMTLSSNSEIHLWPRCII